MSETTDNKNTYAPALNTTYTVGRLLWALENGQKINELVRVGGKKNGPFVISARASIECPTDFAPFNQAQDGDIVTIEFSLADSTLKNITNLAANSLGGHIRVQKLLGCTVNVKTQGVSGHLGELTFTADTAFQWSEFLKLTRKHLYSCGLIEMTTPSLVKNPGMEPELEPFATTWRMGGKECNLYLPTSPELHLKQLLARGHHDIFEIKTVFRNEEMTDQHEPEFQMLEWYRAFAQLDMIISDLEGLIQSLSGSPLFRRGSHLQLKKLTVAELFLQATQFELQPDTPQRALYDLAKQFNLQPSEHSSWNDLFHLIWVAKVEGTLPMEPFLLFDYPPEQAALARLNDRGWADRFEFYWQRVEIANAFHELNDPIEQRKRFERDQKLRSKYGRTPLAIDESFMKALEQGLPPSAGIALGLDRLFMVLIGREKIIQTRPFGIQHQLL